LTEIYKNTTQNASLVITGETADTPPTATLVKGEDETVLTVSEPETVGSIEVWKAYIGLAHTQGGTFDVVWEFTIDGNPVEKVDSFEVVTPYVSLSAAKEALALATVSDEDIMRIERRVRKIINRYCGQSFDLETGTKIVRGQGSENIRLPKRLNKVNSITQHVTGAALEGYEIRHNGLVLRRSYPSYASENVVWITNPIFNPFYDVKSDTFWGGSVPFAYDVEWDITGEWGYHSIPSEVQEAALILMEQYLCSDDLYRQRYVNTMASADFRYSTHDKAWQGTGNAVADYLLRDYVWDAISVI